MKKFKLLDISTWFEQGGMISVKKGDETLNYQIDEDNQSIEVDKATRDYLVDIALVPEREFKKLKDTYIFYIQDLSDEDIVELEEIFECYIPVRMSDRWDGEMAHGGMMAKGGIVKMNDIPDLKEELEKGKVTYRGLGFGKYGKKIKVKGKEYIISQEEFEKISRDENGKMKIKFDAPFRKFAKGGMIEESDIIEGAKFKIKSGIVFIVDEIEDDPEFGKLVRSSMEGGSKGNYRDTMEELIEFLNEEKAEKIMAKGGYAKGGKVRKRFQDKVEAVSERLEGSKVPKKYRKFYGLTYDDSEADEAAKKIVGAQVKKYEKEHITLHKPLKSKNMATAKSKPKSKQGEKIKLISAHAKKIWKKEKEKWTDAVKRASVELKKAGKI